MHRDLPAGHSAAYSDAIRAMPACLPLSSSHLVVAALIHQDGRIALVRQAGPGEEPSWALPGGMVHRDELLTDALVREVHEETGLEIGLPDRLLYMAHLDRLSEGDQWTTFVFELTVGGPTTLVASDPDAIVLEAKWVGVHEAERLLSRLDSRVMRDPILEHLTGCAAPGIFWLYRARKGGGDELVCRLPGRSETSL